MLLRVDCSEELLKALWSLMTCSVPCGVSWVAASALLPHLWLAAMLWDGHNDPAPVGLALTSGLWPQFLLCHVIISLFASFQAFRGSKDLLLRYILKTKPIQIHIFFKQSRKLLLPAVSFSLQHTPGIISHFQGTFRQVQKGLLWLIWTMGCCSFLLPPGPMWSRAVLSQFLIVCILCASASWWKE